MNLKDFSNLDKDDLLDLLGLEKKRSSAGSLAGSLGMIGIGLVVGIGIGFLLAPKAGRGLREDIRDRLRGVPDPLVDSAGSASQPAGA